MATTVGKKNSTHFNPRPPRGERPARREPLKGAANISIHALREESDPKRGCCSGRPHDFNPRPPRGERPTVKKLKYRDFTFQSTPSARRATYTGVVKKYSMWISIHALREESDLHR